MNEPTLRALTPEDADAARALLASRFAGTRYHARLEEQLETALTFDDSEYSSLVAVDSTGVLLGVAVFGTLAGAQRCMKLHAFVGGDEGAMTAMARGVAECAAMSAERLIVCELADDAPFSLASAVLQASGYEQEERVPDFFREGVALLILVLRADFSLNRSSNPLLSH